MRKAFFILNMRKKHFYNFAIIGTGTVGTAIGYLLKESGHNIIAVSDKSSAALKRALPYTGGRTYKLSGNLAANVDCILITTSDNDILSACGKITRDTDLRGKFVFHMSGAGGLDLLEPARKAGAAVASIHPIQSFSSIDNAIQIIPGSVFGITADKKAEKIARQIVCNLDGIPLIISEEQKPLYHAAACFASNYLVALMHVVESIYQSIGLSAKEAQKAYLPLVYGSLNNIKLSGSIQAITGPIARGDSHTIKKHIDAINKSLPQHSSLYKHLGLIASDLGQKKGTLNANQATIINKLLKGVINHEHPE